jgi:ATP-binding cassette subfamily A (ABC1) protein 3
MYYFDQVLPGDHGIAKPWYFPFARLKSILFPSLEDEKRKATANIATKANNFDDDLPVYIEDESIYSSKKVGINIMNLSKVFKQFGKFKKAVDNLSLNIYEGQISVLLGNFIFTLIFLFQYF